MNASTGERHWNSAKLELELELQAQNGMRTMDRTLELYVSADTAKAHYSKSQTLARVMAAYAEHWNRHYELLEVRTGEGSWNDVTEFVVVLTVRGETKSIISLMQCLATFLGQECVMAVGESAYGYGMHTKVTERGNGEWNYDNWTRFDGMGQPRFTYVSQFGGELDVFTVDQDGRIS